jgi:hypothetical protein
VPAVEQCPHREDIHFKDGDESARCGLLCHILNCGEELTSLRVSRGACESCVDGIPPSVDRLNPVLASFLYSAASEIVALGGTTTCDVIRAEELQEWARSSVTVEVLGRRSAAARPRSFRDCAHLGQLTGYTQQPSVQGMVRTAAHTCHHPAHETTTEANCSSCLDWSRTVESQVRVLADVLPAPPSWHSGLPIRWAVGMTTAPRRTPTLETSLDYLRRAGWSNVRLAVYGMAGLPPTTSIEHVSLREPALGAWPNFYMTLLELVLSKPDADAVMLLQDDVQFYDCENVREYLDSRLWPAGPPGIVSLYCSAAYTRETPRWTTADGRWEWGVLGFVFPKELAQRFVCDPQVLQHRSTDRGLRFIDDVIGEWAERNEIPIWYPSPSLVQHIGDTSTVWPGVPAEGYRRADSFVGNP